MTPINATTALAIFAAAAILLDLALVALDRWRRRGVLAVGSDRAVDVQCVVSRGTP